MKTPMRLQGVAHKVSHLLSPENPSYAEDLMNRMKMRSIPWTEAVGFGNCQWWPEEIQYDQSKDGKPHPD